MTLKIEFISDIRGFDRVNKVLEETQKILNSNAEALVKMNIEQSKMQSNTFDMKGLDAIKNASFAVQNLAKSFDTVMSNQGGMKGFLNTFSGFRKEISELNKEQGLNVLDIMSKQIETLKGNVTSGMESIKKLRRELEDAEEGRQPQFLKDLKREAYTDTATRVHAENEAMNKLKMQQMMRQPFLQFGGPQLPGGVGGGLEGFLGGGTNLMRLMGMLGGIAAAVPFANRAAGMGLNAIYTDQRAENAEFAMQRDVYESAFSGNIGRQFLRANRVGREGRLLRNLEEGDGGFFGTQIGDTKLESFLAKMQMGTSALMNFVFKGQTPNAQQMLTEKQNQMSELDMARQAAINDVAARARAQITSQSFMGLEAGRGFGYVRGLQQDLARQNLTLDEGAPALFDARRFGVEEFAARSGLARSSMVTGVSDRARSEIFRRQAYGGVGRGGAYNDYGRILTVAGASGVDLSNMSYREAISDVVAQRTMNIAGQVDAASVTAPFQQALGALNQAGAPLSTPERIQAAANVQNLVQGRMGQTGSMESMGTDFALMELGVREAPIRAQISQLIAAGNTDKAVTFIKNLTGKSEETIRSRLNLAKTQADQFRKTLFFGSEENAKRVEAAAKAAGLSATGAIMSGDANSVLGVAGATEAIERTMPLERSRAAGVTPTKLAPFTTGEQIKGLEAQRNEFAMQQTAALTSTAKDEAGKLVEVFTGFLAQYRSEIQTKLNEVTNEIRKKADAPDLIKTMEAEAMRPENIEKANKNLKVLGTQKRGEM